MKIQYFKNVLAAQFSRQAVKLSTVNVIEMTNGNLQSIRSFADNPEGNTRAERLFKRCIKENICRFPFVISMTCWTRAHGKMVMDIAFSCRTALNLSPPWQSDPGSKESGFLFVFKSPFGVM